MNIAQAHFPTPPKKVSLRTNTLKNDVRKLTFFSNSKHKSKQKVSLRTNTLKNDVRKLTFSQSKTLFNLSKMSLRINTFQNDVRKLTTTTAQISTYLTWLTRLTAQAAHLHWVASPNFRHRLYCHEYNLEWESVGYTFNLGDRHTSISIFSASSACS